MEMRKLVGAFVLLVLAAMPALAGADYDSHDKTALYDFRLRAPATAMAIPRVKARILSDYAQAIDGMKDQAAQEKKDSPDSFRPYTIDVRWRTTFENPAVLSLSGETYSDTGGAHPNGDFQTVVWDKAAAKTLNLSDLFAPSQTKAALAAIHDAATRTWIKTVVKESADAGEPMSVADAQSTAGTGAGGNDDQFALTYATGQSTANGIVFLYGAGAVWPHALGDFRIAVPVSLFGKYLAPQWKSVFGIR
jgi:hypothetical protein